jgi:hypothetical protein
MRSTTVPSVFIAKTFGSSVWIWIPSSWGRTTSSWRNQIDAARVTTAAAINNGAAEARR